MIKFTVYGKPAPQGSTRAFIPKGWKRAIITTDNAKLKPWRQQITDTALTLQVDAIEDDKPVEVAIDFYFLRPKSARNRVGMTVKPDIDKLVRSILDGLTGVLFRDDSQVVSITARKHYGTIEKADICVAQFLLPPSWGPSPIAADQSSQRSLLT